MKSTYSNMPKHIYMSALPKYMHGPRRWCCTTLDDIVRNHPDDGYCGGGQQLTPEGLAWAKHIVAAGESTLKHLIPPELARKLGI